MSIDNIDWDYRLMLEPDGTYRIIEVLYDVSGNITGWAFSDPVGDTLDDLLEVLVDFQATVERVITGNREILTLDDLPDAEEEQGQTPMTWDFASEYVQFN